MRQMTAPVLYKLKGRELIKHKFKKKKKVIIISRIILPPFSNRTPSLKFKTTVNKQLSPILIKLRIKLRRTWWQRCRQGKTLVKKIGFNFKKRSTYLKRVPRKCLNRTAQMIFRNHKPLSMRWLLLINYWQISIIANFSKLRMRQERQLLSL